MDWFTHPAFVTGVAPFLVALILIYALARYEPEFSGMGILSGSWVTALLLSALGYRLSQSLWITLALGLAAIGVGWILERFSPHQSKRISILWGVGIVAAALIVGPVVLGITISMAVLLTIMATLYTGWIVWGVSELRNRPISACSALVYLGVGSGIAALFGDALLAGYLAIGLGFAALAGLIVRLVINWELEAGYLVAVPASLTLGLLGTDALIHGNLSPLSLVMLALIPLYLHFLTEDRVRTIFGLIKINVVLLVITASAAYLAHYRFGH